MIKLSSFHDGRSFVWTVCAVLACVMATAVSFTDTANAANEPDANGVYRYLEIAEDNDFRVYATPGETIHITVYPGVRLAASYPDDRLCQVIRVLQSSGAPVTGLLRISGVRPDNSTFGLGQGQPVVTRDPTDPDQVNACSTGGNQEPFKELTISYTVPAGYSIASMDQAFIVRFAKNTHINGRNTVQGYEWRVAVSDNTDFINSAARPNSNAKPGRVWFVGDDTGLDLWQRNVQPALTSNVTNHVFKFVRNDGYRYAVRYNNYQGIWSTFHGGVYGAKLSSNGLPAYMSYGAVDNPSYQFTLPSGAKNLAYVFVDCGWLDDSCPASIPASVLRPQPITSDSGNTGNPIATVDPSPTASSGFRYTGYTLPNLAGGVVTIPYTAMQTGRIRLEITRSGSPTPLCRISYFIDDADAAGTLTWNWNNAADRARCDPGTSLNTANVPVVPDSEIMTITVQAYRLGEMHFIDVDTEQRGSIEVKGNGLGTAAEKRSIIWYDPFSRSGADTCGTIPVRVADGGASHPTLTWDSMSSGRDWGSTVLPKVIANGASSSIERMAIDSNGGAHGWMSDDVCDGSGTGASDGYANNNGTASDESTWGNDRVVEDWTYAFRDPPPQVLSLGGPTYTLAPSVTVLPGPTIGVGEQADFTMSVTNLDGYNSNLTDWAIRRIVIPPGGLLNIAPRSPTNAADFSCGYYTSVGGGVSCGLVTSGNRVFPAGNTHTVGTNSEVGTTIGSRVCYALMVNSYTQQPKPNFAETVECVTVGKFPHLEARNGDVFAGGQFRSFSPNCTINDEPIISSSQQRIAPPVVNPPYYTSYATYGVTSLGRSVKFGSMGLTYDSTTPSTPSDNLVFANNPADGFFRNDATVNGFQTGLQHCLNDPYAIFGPRTAANNVAGNLINIDLLTSDTNLTASGTVTLYANSTIPAGKKIVIYARNAHIRIASNIQYADQDAGPGGYNDINRIPQVVILTDRSILVDENARAGALSAGGKVTQLDGIYAAKENFYTCDVVPRLNTCATALTVNGAVVVGKNTVPLRTFGADQANYSAMAETFNLRFDMFVNQLPQTGGSSVFIKTLSETEAPPRF